MSKRNIEDFACQPMPDPDCELIPVEKAVARSGALSFKHARLAVKSGRVTIDGNAAVLGMLVGAEAKLSLDEQGLPERVRKKRRCLRICTNGFGHL